MSLNIGVRKNQLKELNEFITCSRKKFLDITTKLQWDLKSLSRRKEMVVCPFDDGHIIPGENLQNHIEQCKLRKECYHPEDAPFPLSPVDSNSSSVLMVDSKLQASILRQAKEKNPAMLIGFPGNEDDRKVPLSSDRFMSSLTSDEKSALHSYVISNTVSPGEGKDISLAEQDLEKNFRNKKEEKRDKTHLERLIEERDAKRRKEGKKVHINRKSHTEIIREVIENQMETYVEWLKDEHLVKQGEPETSKIETSDSHPKDEHNKRPEKAEGNYDIYSKDHPKPWDICDRRERYKHNKDRKKEDFDYVNSRWQNGREVEMEHHNRPYYSREVGSKRHRNYEDLRQRESDSRQFKEHDYRKYNDKRHREDKKDVPEKVKVSKYSGFQNWNDCDHIPKEEEELDDQELERDGKKKRRHGVHRREDIRKQEKERKHHRSKRRHHSSDSAESDYKCKKKEKQYKRGD